MKPDGGMRTLWQVAADLARGHNSLAAEMALTCAEQLRMQAPYPGPGRGNFIRARCGQELGAGEILDSVHEVVVVTSPDDGGTVGPAIIQLPRAADFAGRELTVIDTRALGFHIVTQGDEPLRTDRQECGASRGSAHSPALRQGQRTGWVGGGMTLFNPRRSVPRSSCYRKLGGRDNG